MDPSADDRPGVAIPAAAADHHHGHQHHGNHQHHHHHHPAPGATAAVVSSSEHNHETTSGDSSNDDDDDNDDPSVRCNPDDPTYDHNMDDDDEAWVFRNMRGGGQVQEGAVEAPGRTVVAGGRELGAVGSGTSAGSGAGAGAGALPQGPSPSAPSGGLSSSQQQQQQQGQERQARADLERVKLRKPRSSDAVLSCPCCFTIVCMDCQRHVKYTNQFRAMFVMNIGVRWDKKMVWDEGRGELVEERAAAGAGGGGGAADGHRPDPIPCDDPGRTKAKEEDGEGELYYSVHCASCQTEVAALNMDDEVYHFFGCLASS